MQSHKDLRTYLILIKIALKFEDISSYTYMSMMMAFHFKSALFILNYWKHQWLTDLENSFKIRILPIVPDFTTRYKHSLKWITMIWMLEIRAGERVYIHKRAILCPLAWIYVLRCSNFLYINFRCRALNFDWV